MSAARPAARFRVPGFAIPFTLVLAFAVVLAFEALDAARSHRQSAEQTLEDYADFAAFIVLNVARQEIERRLFYAFGAVRAWNSASGAPLPPPEVMARDPAEAGRCAPSGITEPAYVRLDLATGEFTAAGSVLGDTPAAWLADTLRIEAERGETRGWTFGHVLDDTHGPGLVAWTAIRDSAGTPLAVYAKTSCLAINGRGVFALAMRTTPALPPSLTGVLPNDSLFSFEVRGPDGRVIEASARPYVSAFSGSVESPQLGGIVLHTTLRPDVAGRLVIGGVPRTRVPIALLLLALTLAAGAVTLVQWRRQHELMRTREQFVSNVSHELRTPLQQVLVFSELLRMDRIGDETERRHALAIVERETRRLIQLVDNVLVFSRPGRAAGSLDIRPQPLEPLVRETIQAFDPLAAATGARLVLHSAAGVNACVDADAFKRILLNLLDNAVKYGPRGQTVTVTLEAEADEAVLRVDDQGPGIPVPDRERVFQAFRRLEREARAAIAGSGVGLSIVRDLSIAMNGTASIEDAPGGGARFVIRLPGARAT